MNIGFANHKKGDTWSGADIKVNGYDLTDSQILSQFKVSENGPVVFEFKTQDNTISFTNPSQGMFKFNKRILDYPATTYYFDIQVTFQNGDVLTVVDTHSFTIVNDISK